MHVCVQYFTVAIARRLHGHVDIANVQEVRTGLFNKRFPHVLSLVTDELARVVPGGGDGESLPTRGRTT